MESAAIEGAFRLQKALDSNHPFSSCIDNTGKKLIALITSSNNVPGKAKEETPVPDHDANTFQALFQDLDFLINAIYVATTKAASMGVDENAIRALLLQEQIEIQKYRDEIRTIRGRVAAQDEQIRVICENLGTNNVGESESSTRECIRDLDVRVKAFEAMGLKGLRKEMNEKLEDQNRTHAAELNALRGKYQTQIEELKSPHDNKMSSEFNESATAIGDHIYTFETLFSKVEEIEARCEVLATKASYDEFEKFDTPVEKVQPSKPFDPRDTTSIMEQLDDMRADLHKLNEHLDIRSNAVFRNEENCESSDDTQIQLDAIRAEMEKLDERLMLQEEDDEYNLSDDTVRDEHIQTIVDQELTRLIEEKVVISETDCIDVARIEVEKAIKYAIRSGRVMSKLAPVSMAALFGPPGTVNGVPTQTFPPHNTLPPQYTFAAQPVLAATTGNVPPLIDLASPKAAPASLAATNGTPAAPAVHLPPCLTLKRPTINPTAPAFTPNVHANSQKHI